jgi:hypothetical protein
MAGDASLYRRDTSTAVLPDGRDALAPLIPLLWKATLRPLVRGWMLAANGDAMGGIYAANVVAVAERPGGVSSR